MQLRDAIGGALNVSRMRDLDLAKVPQDIRPWLTHPEDKYGLGTRISADLSGYAVLRDNFGRAAWVFRVAAPAGEAAAVPSAGASIDPRGLSLPLELFLALLAAVVGACVVLALRRYFHHRQAVDSRYKALIDQTNDGIVIVEADGYRIQYCNPAFLAKVGYTSAEAAELALTDVFGDGDASVENVLTRLKNADGQPALNLQLRCKNASQIDVEVRCNRLETDGREGFAYVTHDVSVRRKAEQQLIDNQQRLDRMAHHDQLTGLPNRLLSGPPSCPRPSNEARAANQMLGVVFLHLDRFKHINDTRGQRSGTVLLLGSRAPSLKSCVRDSES